MIEHEARRPAGAEVRGDLGMYRARLRPIRQDGAEPIGRQFAAILLGRAADFLGQVGRWRLDDKIRGPVSGS